MDSVFSNPSPRVRRARSRSCTARTSRVDDSNDRTVEPLVSTEIFDHIKNINDPEHPYSLEQGKSFEVFERVSLFLYLPLTVSMRS